MHGLLTGRTALVTGAAAGLGRRIAERFSAEGANGLAFDIAPAEGELPRGWIELRGNVTDETEIGRAMAQVSEVFGRLDVVVANAGVVPPWQDTEGIDLEEWNRVLDVNVRGVAATIKHAVPLMKQNGGSIVAMGSMNSHRAHAGQGLYTASKHAVLGIVRAAALDLGRYGIRVNALGPGPVATEALLRRLATRAAQGSPPPAEVLAQFAAETALGRMVTADDVAGAAVYLASDLSAGVTGQLLPVDAGLA